MRVFYTVDRLGNLSAGQTLSLFSNGVPNEPFRSFVGGLFPNGVSKHGQEYLENASRMFSSKEGSLELYFEEVRKAYYPHRPSRFESMFCCENLQAADEMAKLLGTPTSPIFEIYVFGDHHRVNMTLLNNQGSLLAVSYRAHAYWRGDECITDPKPVWEIIAKLPVEVGQRVR